ncbi:type I restriction endonuclease subunit R [Nitrosomonas sp. Nm166]|uniref:type I restriction endonuclease subunit R n=1 Tax=Nitrosomonas sp. Nm166 TaxID=1881054 RepID=UPI0008DF8C73|nr:type I restriction endonuclease subunit R [Nitrosomonas sp. Nm166]SFD85789.1 type I restriction enzyme, R subunit [Nitrosomonas sp. Nm166]
MPNFISEDQIERALVQKLQHLHGFDVLDCYTENAEDLNDGSNRSSKRDVILADRVRAAARRLNPKIPHTAIESALEKLSDRRQAMTLIAANREIYGLLRDGIPVEFDDDTGQRQQQRIYLLDFNAPENNRYLAVTQLWVKGERGFRRPDVLLYVNGIPLVFIELKNSNVKLRNAFDDNLTAYKAEIPQLFLTNVFCVLSNAIETKVGSITAQWEHFFNWLRADDEKEKIDRTAIQEQGTSLEGVLAGLLPRQRLLDYVENFVLYYKDSSKIIAQNHQFIGVNRAYGVFLKRGKLDGKLGVFWHTQGSGKSFSMIFYARKIFRKQTGNFTFVVVTDRDDLDGQIYRNFLHTGTVGKAEAAQPKNGEEMRKFLGQNKRVVFTLIQKFRWPQGQEYPELSARDDIIVIVDEAHRTQYKSLAENMRKGLPKAQYLAFTGTPLLGRERKTNAWFGGYVSEYNFQQSMDDGATVPLFYQKRVPEVLIQNEGLSEEFYQILEDENLDEAQQAKLEQRFAKEVEVIKRDSRLETIARDIVYHFPRRGYLGKGMVVSVDKFTAVKMYDKVQRLWKEEITSLLGTIHKSTHDAEKRRLKQMVEYMRAVEMAVVVSEDADEGLNIQPHRERMNRVDEHGHDIEYNFKDAEHPLQLVFVCAMWLTGFDAPTVSTLYLDKPMQGHTLMQTIARANRVTSWKFNGIEKCNGEIVDYYNVFRNMKLALRDYAQGQNEEDEPPVKEKAELFCLLDDAIEQGLAFCHEKGVSLNDVLNGSDVFKNIAKFNQFADTLLANDDWRKAFNVYENTVSSLYEACKPEIMKRDNRGKVCAVAVFQYLRGVIDSLIEQQDIDAVTRKIAELLDQSVVVDGAETLSSQQETPEYQLIKKGKTWDLSKINFDKLREEFKQAAYKHIEIADLRAFLQHKLELMLQQNATRTDFVQRLQQIIDTYNAGGSSAENYYEDLMKFTEDLRAEDERHIREGLTEDELELFDLLKKDKMTQDETQKVKLAAKSLLHRLLQEHPKVLVQDWYKDTQTQRVVRSTVEQVLDRDLPQSYDRVLFREKCDNIFHLMLDYASHGRKWAA